VADSRKFLPQGVDHLGFLNGQLRGLMGFAALANELTQNADDAKAKTLTFDVTDEALIAENDSTFTECQTVDEWDCSFEVQEGRLCDLHRFRRISSGNKREEDNTIGAFGIGFTSVYQITDRPELFTGTRHWIVRPEESQEQRIEQNIITERNSTLFRLPWARNPNSKIRKALSVKAVSGADVEQLFREITKAISDTIMFLKHVRRIELKRNGQFVKEVIIERGAGTLTVKDGDAIRRWLLFEGDFAEDADGLGNSQIVHHRKTKVSVAVPDESRDVSGLLFAYLPTQQSVGLPFHINADFFPTPDRKHILFDDDYQGDWNRLAIRTAAEILTEQLPDLRETLGARNLWDLIGKLQKVAKASETNQYDEVFSEFWRKAKQSLARFPSVYTSQRKWVYPAQAFILQNYKTEKPVIPLLEELTLNVVHEDLASYQNILRSNDVGVKQYKLINLADALLQSGLNKLVPFTKAPDWLRREENQQVLADEIKYLLENTQGNEEGRMKIRQCAIAKSCGENFDTPETLFRTDQATREIFQPLGLDAYFLADDNFPVIVDLAETLTTEAAIEVLRDDVEQEVFSECLEADLESFIKLIKWVVNASLNADEETKENLRALKIWLSGGNLSALDDLVVPGDFSDPLQLASVVDLETLKIPSERLIEIGAQKLTFQNYVKEQLPGALRGNVNPDVRRRLVELFAEKRSDIHQDVELRKIIASFRIIECQDGEFRAANSIYFSNDETKRLLGSRVSYVDPPVTYPLPIRELYKYLGIADRPKTEDLLKVIVETVLPHPTNNTRNQIRSILLHLGRRWNDSEDSTLLIPLKTMHWLPAENDGLRWYRPAELFAPFQKYLFETTGKFVDLPLRDSTLITPFFKFLGVNTVPSTKLVVEHLQKMVRAEQSVNREVYTFLERNTEDALVIGLRGKNCILLPDNTYVSPDKVFWSEHPFGSYRYRLGTEMGQYKKLFDALGVKDEPEHPDAIAVLKEISKKFAPGNLPLDEESQRVVRHCWLKLHDANNELEQLRDVAVVLTNSNQLDTPGNLYFDDLPGVAEELGLAQHAIPRPSDTWQPMQQAGVKFLSEAVSAILVETVNPKEDEGLTRKLRWGYNCIARVVEAARKDGEFLFQTAHLSKVKFVKTDKLSIQYAIADLNRTSKIIQAPAFYDTENQTVFFQESPSSLNSISCEIARSISTQTDIGSLASGIKEVISGESFEEADHILDILGYAKVDLREIELAAASTITELGGTTIEETEELAEFVGAGGEISDQEALENAQADKEDSAGGEIAAPVRKFGANLNHQPQPAVQEFGGSGVYSQKTSTENGAKGFSTGINKSVGSGGNSNQGRQKPSAQLGTGNLTSDGAKKKPQTSLPRAQGRLLSYVENDSFAKESRGEDEADTEFRKKIDAAGIQKVLEYEKRAGRDPEEMQHNYKGFDIKSFNQAGKPERYIEVKSTSGEWGSYGVKLSVAQYEKSVGEGDRYWLYVVERADKTDAKIYCIQNPAAQITNYCFDNGWKNLDKK
jgi:hypothetical protein